MDTVGWGIHLESDAVFQTERNRNSGDGVDHHLHGDEFKSDSDADSDSHRDTNSDAGPHPNANRDSYSDANRHADVYSSGADLG